MRSARTADIDDEILDRVEEELSTNTRCLPCEFNIPKTIYMMFYEMFSYAAFWQFIQKKELKTRNILFAGEACCSRSDVTNFYNELVCTNDNPHVIKVTHH